MNRTKSLKEKRTKVVKVMLTEGQKDIITAKAKQCGMSVSTYLMKVGAGYKPHSLLSEKELEILMALAEYLKELKRFGSMLTAKAKHLTSPAERMAFLSQVGVTTQWREKIDRVADFLYAMLSNINFKFAYSNDSKV